jgi:hypothetical protein
MLKQFYEKALPSQGVYCVSGLVNGRMTNRFAETLDGVLEEIEKLKEKNADVFVAPGSFEGYSRKADDCVFVRSFFIDLDVGEGKEFATKQDAHDGIENILIQTGLPEPVRIDSGGGIHAYWIMDTDIPKDEWKPAAEVFKSLCLQYAPIDPVVTADAARIMRCPETFNQKTGTPRPTSVISDEIHVYNWVEFKAFLMGEEGAVVAVKEATPIEIENILASVPKGLDDDTKAMLKLDNFPRTFEVLAQKSVDEEGGCAQVKFMCENVPTLEEPLWRAGLSLAKFCDDGATAIHEFSEDHPKYTHAKTEEKASGIPAPRTCEWFIDNYPNRCEGCAHRGKIVSPISLAREFTPAKANTEKPIWEAPGTQTIPNFPDALMPFVRGQHGGIYFVPAPKVDKKGVKHQDDPILILSHDLYPITRMVSPLDGECLQMRLELPKDGYREFLLPMKHVYAKESFKSIMSSNGVLFNSLHDQHLMNYIVKWGQYLQTTEAALQMRMQMGWTKERDVDTDEWPTRSFVIGTKEITYKGETIDAPSSPFVKGLSRHLIQHGTFQRWRESMDYLNKPGFEVHAFASMSGFGSTLMNYTNTSGVVMSLTGDSGSAKTGAMYAGLSVFGHPKNLSVVDGTDNGLTGRYLGLHSLMLGLDEVGDKEAKELGRLVHNVSHGKAKIRMQASVNAEREYEMSASLIAVLTSNHGLYGILEAAKMDPNGEAARLIEFMVKRPSMLENNSRLGKYIFDAFRHNYGHAGPMFIKEIITRSDNYVLDNILKWEDKFIKDFGDYVEYRFYQNLVGVNMGAATIANEHGITDYALDRTYETAVVEMINIRDKVIKINRSDYPSVLADFINRNMANILVIKEGRVTMEPRGPIVARIVSDESLVQVSKAELKKFLGDRKISTREFETDMRSRNKLVDDKKGRLTTGWKNAISVDPAYLYWFRTELPAELINDSAT